MKPKNFIKSSTSTPSEIFVFLLQARIINNIFSVLWNKKMDFGLYFYKNAWKLLLNFLDLSFYTKLF
jgi:hypothetical protein